MANQFKFTTPRGVAVFLHEWRGIGSSGLRAGDERVRHQNTGKPTPFLFVGGNALGQGFDQVVALIGQGRVDRLDQHVIGQDPVHVIVRPVNGVAQINGQGKAQALRLAPFGLEGADFGGHDMVAQVDAVGLGHARHSPQIRAAGKPALVRGDPLPARTIEDVLADPHGALEPMRP